MTYIDIVELNSQNPLCEKIISFSFRIEIPQGIYKLCQKTPGFKAWGWMASFRSEAEAFSGMSGMAEGHDRYARGLKPRALARGVGSFS